MVELRPLIVITGTLHVEGGIKKKSTSKRDRKVETHRIVTEDQHISPDRRAGNVIASNYMRRIRQLKILRTPFGALVDAANLIKIKDTLNQATIDAAGFNKRHKTCQVSNTMLWEHLRAQRLEAVRAWIEQRLEAEDEEVKEALVLLQAPAVAA